MKSSNECMAKAAEMRNAANETGNFVAWEAYMEMAREWGRAAEMAEEQDKLAAFIAP